jgi:hypothetical protein
MKRREVITLLGGATVAWPLIPHAQPAERVRRLGFLDAGGETDELSRAGRAALAQGLAALGWVEGRNLKTDQRSGAGDTDRMRTSAAELVALAPDLLIGSGAAATRAAGRDTDDSDRLHRRW